MLTGKEILRPYTMPDDMRESIANDIDRELKLAAILARIDLTESFISTQNQLIHGTVDCPVLHHLQKI